MGKDIDEACCDSCRRFGGDNPEVPVPPPAIAIAAPYSRVRILVRDRDGEREVTPTGPVVTFGRVAGNDVVVRDSALSKRQFRLLFGDGRIVVQDTKSTCGTYVDGRKVHTAELREGSVINAGDSEIRVVRTPA